MAEQTPAGWYHDPGNPGHARWWDGAQWTVHLRALEPTPPPPPTNPQPAGGSILAAEPEPEVVNGTFDAGPNVRPRSWWRRKRVLIPAGLVALAGIVSISSGGSEPEPIALTSGAESTDDLDATDVDPSESSTTTATTATTSTTAVASSSSNSTTTTTAPSSTITPAPTTSAPTTSATAPPPTEATTTQATAAQASTTATTTPSSTTAAPTTAAPPTEAPTTAAPPTEAPTTIVDHVNPGSFCSPPGATGRTSTGKPMVCSLANADGVPYSEGRARWRSP